jgi:threonine dehydrogenase-like Zn-dependent dehydrogenase
VLAVDGIQTHLAVALEQNAEVINFNDEDPIEVIKHLTGGIGADRVIDAVGIIGVYSPQFDAYPIGQAMNKNLTVRMGNCNHRRYIPRLLDLAATGLIDPAAFITQQEKPDSAIDAYQTFDRREEGWLKTVIDVS